MGTGPRWRQTQAHGRDCNAIYTSVHDMLDVLILVLQYLLLVFVVAVSDEEAANWGPFSYTGHSFMSFRRSIM